MKGNLSFLILVVIFAGVLFGTIKNDKWVNSEFPKELFEEQLENIHYTGSKGNAYFIDLRIYEQYAENLITLHILDQDKIIAFRARYVTNVSFDDIIKNVPDKPVKTDFDYVEGRYEGYYHLYFRKDTDHDADAYLVIYLEVKDDDGGDNNGTLILSKREEVHELYGNLEEIEVDVGDYVPFIAKIKVSEDHDYGNTYMIYSNVANYQTVFEGRIFKNDKNHALSVHNEKTPLYGFLIPEDDQCSFHLITVILFGPQVKVLTQVKRSYSKTIFINKEKREDGILHMETYNCFDPFYIIGNYMKKTEQLIYFEKLFGDFTLYYESKIFGPNIDEALPRDDDKLDDDFLITKSTVDIFKGICTSPCGFNVHHISDWSNTVMSFGEQKVIFLKKDTDLEISLATDVSVEFSLYFEIRYVNPYAKVTLDAFGQGAKTMKQAEVTQYLKSKREKETLLFNSNADTVLVIKLATKNHYIEIVGSDNFISHYAMIPIKTKDSSFIDVTIFKDKTVKNVDLIYEFRYGSDIVITDPVGTRIKDFTSETFNIQNPLLQSYPLPAITNAIYYLIIKIDSEEDVSDKIIVDITDTIIQPKELLKKETYSRIETGGVWNLEDPEAEKSLLIIITKCNDRMSEMKLNYYNKSFKGFYNKDFYSFVYYKTPFKGTSISFDSMKRTDPFPGVMIYYDYMTANEFENVTYDDDFDLNFSFAKDDPNTLILSWVSCLPEKETPKGKVDIKIEYKIYNYHESNNGNFNDICRAQDLTPIETIISDEYNLIHKIHIDKSQHNYFFITGQPTSGFRLTFSYRTFHVPLPIELTYEKKETIVYTKKANQIEYFYVDLSTFDYREEAILTLKVQNQSEIEKFHARLVTGITREKMMENMPSDKEKNQYSYMKTAHRGYFNLYFRKNVEDTEKVYLLIYLEIKGSKDMSTASLTLSSEVETYNIFATTSRSVILRDYIPTILKFEVKKSWDSGNSYFYHLDTPNIQIAYNGHLLADFEKNTVNENAVATQFYAFVIPDTVEEDEKAIFTIVLFGPSKTVYFEIINSFSRVFYFHAKERPIHVQHVEIDNSLDPFYIIGTYENRIETLIYFERLFGDLTLTYKNNLDGKVIEEILPNMKEVKEKIYHVVTDTNIDLITGECTSPCGFNVHYVDKTYQYNTVINEGEQKIFYMKKGVKRKVTLSEKLRDEKEINLLLINPASIENLTYNLFNDEPKTLSGYSSITVLLEERKNFDIVFLSSDSDAIVDLRIGTKEEYKKYSEDSETITTKRALIPIVDDKTISGYQITISDDNNIDSNVYFYFGYNPENMIIDALTKKVEHFTERSFIIQNPYLQSPPKHIIPKSIYYLQLKIETEQPIKFTYFKENKMLIKKDILPKSDPKLIPELKEYELEGPIPNSVLMLLITKCTPANILVTFSYNTKTFKGFYVKRQFHHIHFHNPFKGMTMKFTTTKEKVDNNEIFVYYDYPSDEQHDEIKFKEDFGITYQLIHDAENLVKIYWEAPHVEQQNYEVKYEIYVYNEKNKSNKIDICRLSEFTPFETVTSRDFKLSQNIVITPGQENYIFIVATPSQVILNKFYYKTIMIDFPEQLTASVYDEIKLEKGMNHKYYYADLSKYKKDQQGIITLNVPRKQSIVKFHASYVENIEPGKILENMPVDQTENQFTYTESILSNYYHLYFRKTSDAQEKAYLLIYLELEAQKDYDIVKIVLSEPESIEEIQSNEQQFSVSTKEHVPIIKRIIVNKGPEFGDHYMIYTNNKGYQTIFHGAFYEKNKQGSYEFNKNNNNQQLYAYNIKTDIPDEDKEDKTHDFTLVYFTAQKNDHIFVDIENTFSEIIYMTGPQRPKNNVMYIEITNSFNEFYMFGLYDRPTNGIIYFERLFGDFNIAHQEELKGKRLKDMYNNFDDKLPYNYFKVDTEIDLMSGLCTSPCGFNVHFLPLNNPSPVESNANGITNADEEGLVQGKDAFIYLPKNSKQILKLSPSANTVSSLPIEIRNIEESSFVKVKLFNQDEIDLREFHNVIVPKSNRKNVQTIEVSTGRSHSLIKITLGSKNEYQIMNDDFLSIKTPYVMIPLDNEDLSFSGYTINVSKKSNKKVNLYYSFGYGPKTTLIDPIHNKISDFNTKEYKLENPSFQKTPASSIPNSIHYLQLYFEAESNEPFEIDIIKENNVLQKFKELPQNIVHHIKKSELFSLDYPSTDEEKLYMSIHKCFPTKDSIYKMKYHQETRKAFALANNEQTEVINNPYKGMGVFFDIIDPDPFNEVLFYYSYASQYDIDNMNSLSQDRDIYRKFAENDNSTVILSWESLLPAGKQVKYSIYQYFDLQSENLNDICRINSITPIKELTSNEAKLSHTITVDRKKINSFFVVAEPIDGIHAKFFYDTNTVDAAEIASKFNNLWLYIAIGILGTIVLCFIIAYIAICIKRKKQRVEMTKIEETGLVENLDEMNLDGA